MRKHPESLTIPRGAGCPTSGAALRGVCPGCPALKRPGRPYPPARVRCCGKFEARVSGARS